MRKAAILAIMLLTTPTQANAQEHGSQTCKRGGAVVLWGGQWKERFERDFILRVVSLCSSENASVLIVPFSGTELDGDERELKEWVQHLRGFWTRAGVKRISSLDLKAFNDREAAARVDAHSIIYIPGGVRQYSAAWMEKAPVTISAIRRAMRRSKIVAADGGGAASLGKRYFESRPLHSKSAKEADELRILQRGVLKYYIGMNVLPGYTIQTSFSQSGQFADLTAAVLDDPVEVGIGLDNNTGIIITSSGAEVFGHGTVTIIDGRSARISPVSGSGVYSASDMRVSILRGGDRLSWRSSGWQSLKHYYF
jgi:cyanophycinase